MTRARGCERRAGQYKREPVSAAGGSERTRSENGNGARGQILTALADRQHLYLELRGLGRGSARAIAKRRCSTWLRVWPVGHGRPRSS